MVDGACVYRRVALVTACLSCHVICGCPTLRAACNIFALGCEADECFICVTRLYKVVDGTFVYRGVTLVTACLSCL